MAPGKYYGETRAMGLLLLILLANLGFARSQYHVKLVNGTDHCSGRVEVVNSTGRGTVCHNYWDLKDAEVVCRQLGCRAPLSAPSDACFGEGTAETWFDDVQCSGSESSLILCNKKTSRLDCSHRKDAGVVCEGTAQRSCNIASSASAVRPGEQVKITCSRSPQRCTTVNFFLFKQGLFVEKSGSSTDSANFTLSKMVAGHQGQYTCQFEYSGTKIRSSQSDAVVITVVSLSKPSISGGQGSCPDATPDAQGSEVTRGQALQVTRGHAFHISCSCQSEHAGSFLLQQISPNGTLTSHHGNSSARAHSTSSACFPFHTADLYHRGNYSCVYQVTVASHNFKSPESYLMAVTITASFLLPILAAAGGLLFLIIILSLLILLWRCRRSNRDKTLSTDTGAVRSREPVEDDDRDYESVDDDNDGDDYINSETLGGRRKKSLEEEEDYINTETLGEGKRRSTDHKGDEDEEEEEDYINTESLGLDEDEEDYVNTETLGERPNYEHMEMELTNYESKDLEDYERMGNDLENYERMGNDLEDYERMGNELDDYERMGKDLDDYESMDESHGQSEEEDYVNVDEPH
ncbi:uncharacterized protein LOC134441067 [Engraulis encrasicolus]|uniref:uncharacterized protein LOC134441067 n=1 Tax=Engraulis encrasicolus TaxID=184585 RepID=UPI002FD2E44D